MKENTMKLVRTAKNGAGKALMVLSLVGMMGMNVSAANGRELTDINKDVNVSKYNLSLNANGRIEYDKNLDGKKEVFYDYLDYQKLAESLETINKNETELKNEYTRLYNLAEQNRKDIIASWNARFAPNQQIDPNKGTYVTGTGTASIKGAIDTMPVHTFDEIGLSFANGSVSITYPNPAWGYYKGGSIPTAQIEAQIAEAMSHTEIFKLKADNTKNWSDKADMTESHKNRYVDWSECWNTAYGRGVHDGQASLCARIEKLNVWDGVASVDHSYLNWDDGAGNQHDGKEVLLDSCLMNDKNNPNKYGKVDWVAQSCIDYCYGEANGDILSAMFVDTDLSHWTKTKVQDKVHYDFTRSITEGNVTYTAKITVWSNEAEGHKFGSKGGYHVGNVYVWMSVQ